MSSNKSHCFFPRTTNWVLKTVRFQEWPINWDCATLSHWSPANCKSRFQIISLQDLSATFDTVNHRFLDHSSSSHTLHNWVPSYRHMAYPTIAMAYPTIADDTQLYLSFQPDDPMVAAWISGCLADISAWMKEHHLQLNLAKTELLVFPATPTLQHDFTIQLGSSTITH